MAAPSGTVWGSKVNNYGRIGIYKSISSTATTTTVSVEIWFWSVYSCSDSSHSLYFDNLGTTGSASTKVSSTSINTTVDASWSTSNQQKLKTLSYSYTRGTSAQTRYLYAKLSNVDRVGGTMYASTTLSIPALDSYTVSYDANGGSGAPSGQTKWHGTTLTLSSTKPTRTGYTFVNWLSSAQNKTYSPGAFYGYDESTTMKAQWSAVTYTVSYNANGGSGAPGSQTKTHGTALTLSSTKPTRTNYTFLGWATTASATTATYAAGASYTANAAITLYAVWRLNYTKPRITNLNIYRADEQGDADNNGACVIVHSDWETDYANPTITIVWTPETDGENTFFTGTASGATNVYSGSSNWFLEDWVFSTEKTYTFTLTVTDIGGSTTVTGTLNSRAFTWHSRPGGDGIAFGKVSEKSKAVEFAWDAFDKFGALMGNGLAAYTGGGDSGIDPDTTLEGLCLTSHTNGPKGLGTFYYIQTVFYNTKSVTAARAQFAFPYKMNGSTYHRYYASGAWSPWQSQALEAYPVGSYYISHVDTSPASLFGGTWHRIESRFLWAAPSTSTLGLTAGEQTHTLTVDEIPSHNHSLNLTSTAGTGSFTTSYVAYTKTGGTTYTNANAMVETGGGAAHNNMPPYVNVAIWRRTA